MARLQGPEKQKTLATQVLLGLKVVAWGGIEPPTQGFSKYVFVNSPMFTGLAAR